MESPRRLPRADEAEVDPRKLYDYALNPDHAEGRHKARVFRSALGIAQVDWPYLRDQILERLAASEVTRVESSPWGFQYGVRVRIDGLNGATHAVMTGWIVVGDRPPKLTTIMVDI